MRDEYEYSNCVICGKPFTDDEWEERHTDPATGEDCHERCCPKCNPKRKQKQQEYHGEGTA